MDLSGLGPHIAHFRRWLDSQPSRDFSELTITGKLGRLALIIAALVLVLSPVALIVAGQP